VFDANRMHPGAAHYMIHSFDDPVHAPLGLRAARVYAQIAPAAAHAQHMISHIYVALGEWNESVAANVISFDVSSERRDRKELGIDSLNYHSLHWLEYSYLQLGRWEEARETLEQMTRYARESGSARALWYHAAMRAAWIVETGGMEAPDPIDSEAAQVTGVAAGGFATGYAALLAGNREMAELAALTIGNRHEAASHGPLCDMTSGYDSTTKRDLVVAEVLQKSLQALIELDRDNTEAALALLDEVTAAEEAMPMDFGPPIIVKPTNELYGEVLLQLGRPEEARLQFEKALERAPRRTLSLAGLAQAAKGMGQAAAGAGACAELASIYAGADESLAIPGACSS
jgi:tetratricopeptide (TPR) repeat protein